MPSIVIAQGGGPTAVINQTLCGAILAARRHNPSLRILGARYGVRGLTAGNVVDLTTIPEAQLCRLGNTPNSALGSTRDKPDSGACADILAALDRLDGRKNSHCIHDNIDRDLEDIMIDRLPPDLFAGSFAVAQTKSFSHAAERVHL